MHRLGRNPADELDDQALGALYDVPDTDGRPHLRLNFVCSVDGAVTVGGVAKGLQTPGDNRIFTLLRDLADVVLVGAGTVRAEGYRPLRVDADRRARRTALGRPVELPIAVVSSSLELDPDAELFSSPHARTTVITHRRAPAERRAALAASCDVIAVGDPVVDLPAALRVLADRGLRRILCEGGPHLFGALLAADCVDELCLTVSPLLVGPAAGRIVAGLLETRPARLRLDHVLEEDDALFCRYRTLP